MDQEQETQVDQTQQDQTQDQTPEFSSDAFINASDGIQEPEEHPAEQQPGGAPPGQETQQQQAAQQQATQQQVLDEYWGQFQEEVGDIDEDLATVLRTGVDKDGNPITAKQKFQMLADNILDNVLLGGNEQVDNFVRNFMSEAQKENFDINAFVKAQYEQTNVVNLPPKEFLTQYYKSLAKQSNIEVTDEEIEDKLNRMSTLDQKLEAEQLKKGYQAQYIKEQETARIARSNEIVEEAKKSLVQTNKGIQDNITTYVSSITEKKTMGGFMFSEAEKKKFIDFLPEFLEKKVVDRPDGSKIVASKADLLIGELLAKPEKTQMLMPYLYLVATNQLDGYITKLISEKKDNIEKSLDLTPESQANRGVQHDGTYDPDAFTRASEG